MAWPISDRSDAELVGATLDGQVEAFNVLVRRWERKVYGYLAHVTGRNDDAFDLCQEVFLAAYLNLSQLREPGRFRAWLFQIAHNTAFSHFRGPKRFEDELDANSASSSLPETRLGDGSVWESGELKALLENCLAQLPAEQREAIVLKVYEGFKFTEIAEIQDCPVSTVKTRLYTGFDQLKTKLQR